MRHLLNADAARALAEVQTRAVKPTDLSDHLETLFLEALATRPRLTVELGVRGGESTFVLERVARLANGVLVSVDIDDCSNAGRWEDGYFVRADDVPFAREFPDWCRERALDPKIDLLFVDTSHEYEHTVAELAAWLPLLGPAGKAVFHDSNMRPDGRRRDGSPAPAPLQRGVARALQERLGHAFDFAHDFTVDVAGWRVTHHAYCHGFTILERR